jgi:hypothetical protein
MRKRMVVLATLTVLAGCGSEAVTDTAQGDSDLSFFEPMRLPEAASGFEPPDTLDRAYKATSVTVLANVKNVRPGRTIKGDAGELQWVVVELDVVEVLNGELEPTLNGKTEVEFAANWAPEPVDPVVQHMRANLPSEPSVWLLLWEGGSRGLRPGVKVSDLNVDTTKYVVANLEIGVFAEENGVLVSATAQEGSPSRGARKQAEDLATVEALAEHARKFRSPHLFLVGPRKPGMPCMRRRSEMRRSARVERPRRWNGRPRLWPRLSRLLR